LLLGFWIYFGFGSIWILDFTVVIGILDLPVLRSSRLLLRRMDFGFGSIWILDFIVVIGILDLFWIW